MCFDDGFESIAFFVGVGLDEGMTGETIEQGKRGGGDGADEESYTEDGGCAGCDGGDRGGSRRVGCLVEEIGEGEGEGSRDLAWCRCDTA